MLWGARYAHFVKHGDQGRKEAADAFLKAVDGLRYRTEDVLVPELLERLHALKQAHFGHNNFYNEWPHASSLSKSLPPSGLVPRAVRREWVKVISQCWIGNGHGYKEGVDEEALKHYDLYIGNFGDSEIVDFIDLFKELDFTLDFYHHKPDSRVRKLASDFRSKTSSIFIRRSLDLIIGSPGGVLSKLSATTSYKTAAADLPKFDS